MKTLTQRSRSKGLRKTELLYSVRLPKSVIKLDFSHGRGLTPFLISTLPLSAYSSERGEADIDAHPWSSLDVPLFVERRNRNLINRLLAGCRCSQHSVNGVSSRGWRSGKRGAVPV